LTWYTNRLRAAQEQQHSRLAVEIAPWAEKIPYPLQRYDDAFLPFSKAIIDATAEFCCAYVFNLAAYLSLGASGAVALERAIAYVPSPIIKILHAPFASPQYVRAVGESGFAVDAVTLVNIHPGVDLNQLRDLVTSFLKQPERGAYLYVLDDETGDPLLDAAEELETEFAGQLGTYSWWHERGFYELENGDVITDWHGDAVIYASRGDDYQKAMQEAALARRGWDV
jgi:hypothetical protein